MIGHGRTSGEIFTRRTGAWRVQLLPGWDAIEDLMGAALVSRQPFDAAMRFRACVNVVEVTDRLPSDLHAFAEEQAARLTSTPDEVLELYALPPNSRSRVPGVLAVGIVVSTTSPELGITVINEQTWADSTDGSLLFTLMAEEDWYTFHRDAMLSVPRSLEFG
jgi:hypothetical protein